MRLSHITSHDWATVQMPVPSQLCSLSDLPARTIGDKVRFLGCVISYDVGTATLTLGHRFLDGSQVRASVDMRPRLESLKSEDTRQGQWLNVMGYVTFIRASNDEQLVGVQAILHWAAGAVDIDKYETVVEQESATLKSIPP